MGKQLTDGEKDILAELEADARDAERVPAGFDRCFGCGELVSRLEADEMEFDFGDGSFYVNVHPGCSEKVW